MSGTIEDIAKKWLAEPAYNKVLFFHKSMTSSHLTSIGQVSKHTFSMMNDQCLKN